MKKRRIIHRSLWPGRTADTSVVVRPVVGGLGVSRMIVSHLLPPLTENKIRNNNNENDTHKDDKPPELAVFPEGKRSSAKLDKN